MSLARQIARTYFEYSNQSDMAQIRSLLTENCTYYSRQLGFFIGRDDVIAMQAEFHDQYQSLSWEILSLNELKPNVVEIEFDFEGILRNGELQKRQGREHILIYDGLIQHIAVGI
jgi:hypothetical protein